jgi:hypothetical protein
VRDELWKQAIQKCGPESVVMQIWTDQNPQGFSYRQQGAQKRAFVEFEGMALIWIPDKKSDDR